MPVGPGRLDKRHEVAVLWPADQYFCTAGDASWQWLEEQLGLADPGKTVVVTHHAPHPRSVPVKFEGHPLSLCYATALEAMMGKASTWIHGHILDSVDYKVQGTRIVTNLHGYRLRGGACRTRSFGWISVWMCIEHASAMLLRSMR